MIEDNENLRISLLQLDIKWEDISYNLEHVHKYLSLLEGKTDLAVLPEMFSTGFSMNSSGLAEENNGPTITALQNWSRAYNIVICGSFIAEENKKFYNRGFIITPDQSSFYDKRHLFRMGGETDFFSAGNNRCIIEHKGFKICLLVCYDLRFPVWARNINNEYDLLIYVANWPKSRIKVWNTLLEARAIENLAYVCGVNRVGEDKMKILYNGQSTVVDFKGNKIISLTDPVEMIETIEISKKDLKMFREKFPVWKDADKFNLI